MSLSLDTTLPLAAAVVYALSALFLKRATIEGGGLWRITFLTNWGQAVFLLPLLFVGHGRLNALEFWHILVTSFIFFLGQLSVFAGMRYGDVSVVTPVMGVKVIFVAALVTHFAQEKLPLLWWIAATISAGAAALLAGGRPREGGSVWPGLAGGLGAALAFSGVDVLYQEWAGGLGVWRFSACVALVMGLWSLTLLPILEGAWWKLPRPAARAFAPGLAATIGQVLLMAYCVVELKGAAWANLLYSSRGLWSVALVWAAGAAFGNNESDAGGSVMLRRLTGAGLMLAAIALVLTSQQH
jgi:drug/metabolite transporter (DMT)-like permease